MILRFLMPLLLALLLAPAAHAGEDPEALRAEIDALRSQIEMLERRLDRMAEEQAEVVQTETEEVAAAEAENEPDGIEFGGAVRLNYAWRDYDAQNKDRVGDFELELFRIDVAGTVGDVMLDAQWRRYNDFQAIHHAWFGYRFSETTHMELGITQVPFGILPYASHSFWFGGTYYLGLEDDYDTGIKFERDTGDWLFHWAFFKNPEYANDARYGRYSFDIVTGGAQQNSETNQFNFRAGRTLGESSELGLSLQWGQLYNRTTQRDGDRWAIGVHYDGRFDPWNVQLQAIRYEYNPANPVGVSDDYVQIGAFDFPFMAAARANVWSVNFARNVELDWGPVTGATCYNNFTYIDPQVTGSASSIQNVTGCAFSAGGLYTYVDWINGRNMWFAGGPGIGLGGPSSNRWTSRLNINFGYYF